jgi:hypothetical protein
MPMALALIKSHECVKVLVRDAFSDEVHLYIYKSFRYLSKPIDYFCIIE